MKQTIKRRKPGFAESYYGFKTFGQMLEEAAKRGLIEIEKDEKSGSYIITASHTKQMEPLELPEPVEAAEPSEGVVFEPHHE